MDQALKDSEESLTAPCDAKLEHVSSNEGDAQETDLPNSDHHDAKQVCNVDGSSLDQTIPKDEESAPNSMPIAPVSDESDDEQSIVAEKPKGEERWTTITSTAGISYVQREVVCNHAVKLAPNIIRPAMNDSMSNSDEMINEIGNFIDKIWYGPVAMEHFNVLDEAKIKEFLADRAEDLYLDLSKVTVWENGMPSLLETRAETSDEFVAFHVVLERNQEEGRFTLRGVEPSDTYGRDGCVPIQLGFYFKRGIAGMAVTEHLRMMAARGEGNGGFVNDEAALNGDQEEEDILANASTYASQESEAANGTNAIGDDPDDFFVFQPVFSEEAKEEISVGQGTTSNMDMSNMDISALEMTLLEDGGDDILNDEMAEATTTTNEASSEHDDTNSNQQKVETSQADNQTSSESQTTPIADEMMEFENHVMSSEIDALINDGNSQDGVESKSTAVQTTVESVNSTEEEKEVSTGSSEGSTTTSNVERITEKQSSVVVSQQNASNESKAVVEIVDASNHSLMTSAQSESKGCLEAKEEDNNDVNLAADVNTQQSLAKSELGDSLVKEPVELGKKEPNPKDSLISEFVVEVKTEPNVEDSLIMAVSVKKEPNVEDSLILESALVKKESLTCVGAMTKQGSLISNHDESNVKSERVESSEETAMIDETSRMTVSSVLSNYRSETSKTSESESQAAEGESSPSITTTNSFLFFDPFTSKFSSPIRSASSSSSTLASSSASQQPLKLPYGLYSPILANFKSSESSTPVKAPRLVSSSGLIRSSSSSSEGTIPFPASSPVTPLKVTVPGGPVAPSPKKPRKPRKKRCGQCAGCIVAGVCGECTSCKAKVKFGGDGKNRMGCLKRRCLNPIDGVSETPSLSTEASAFGPQIVVQPTADQPAETLVRADSSPPILKQRKPRKRRCGTCEGCLVKDICGECKSCKVKVKFGGDGRTRLGCLKRQCLNPIHAEGYEKKPKEKRLMKRVRISVTDRQEKRMRRITKKQRLMKGTSSESSTDQQQQGGAGGEMKTKMQVTNVKMDVFFPRWFWLEMQNERTEEERQEAFGYLSLFVRQMERRVCMFVDDSNSKGARRCPFRMSTNRDAFDFEPIPYLLPSTVVGTHEVNRVEWCIRSRDATPAMLATEKLRPLEQDPTLLRLGCTTFVDVLDEETLEEVEEKTLEVFENSRRNAKTMLRPGTYQHTFAARGRSSSGSRTVTRTKMFFNARYLWNSSQLSHISAKRARGIRIDVEKPPRYTTDVVLPALFRCGALKEDAIINQVAINIYHTGTTGIAPHYDDNARFELPVTSIRVFSDSRLSFGCKGSWGISNGEFEIPMMRNSVLVLQEDSYASDVVKHCVRPSDMSGRSAVLLFRKIHEELLREAYEVEMEDITYRFERASGGYDVKDLVQERLDKLLDEVVTCLDLSDDEEEEEEDEVGGVDDDVQQKEQLILESESGKDVIIEPGIGMEEEEEEPAMVQTDLVVAQQAS